MITKAAAVVRERKQAEAEALELGFDPEQSASSPILFNSMASSIDPLTAVCIRRLAISDERYLWSKGGRQSVMYKNIVVAVDGSAIADNASKHAIALAKEHGAKLTAATVTEPYETSGFTSTAVVDASEYRKMCKEYATDILTKVVKSAKAARVSCKAIHKDNHYPYAGIIEAAEQGNADLIVIGSHGRRGLEALLVGSQAAKLLTHTKLPTLVIR